jgi:hypothetical protein
MWKVFTRPTCASDFLWNKLANTTLHVVRHRPRRFYWPAVNQLTWKLLHKELSRFTHASYIMNGLFHETYRKLSRNFWTFCALNCRTMSGRLCCIVFNRWTLFSPVADLPISVVIVCFVHFSIETKTLREKRGYTYTNNNWNRKSWAKTFQHFMKTS